MPISGFDPIMPCMMAIQGIAPKSVLDVGIGCGQWGFLVRNYHDLRYGRFYPKHWEVQLIGIEVFDGYRNAAWDLYSDVLIGDAASYIKKWADAGANTNPFDVSIMIEVLEHFDKEKGTEVLNNLAKISKNIIFSYANMEQGAAFDNPYEIHRSRWTDEEIRAIFPNAVQIYETGVGKFYHVKVGA